MVRNSNTPTPDIPVGDNDRKFRPPGYPTVKSSEAAGTKENPVIIPKIEKMAIIWTVPPIYPFDDVDNNTKSHDFIF
ncbi:MAG: hypothetical protein ABIC40_02285 [bacterium]